MASFPCPSYGLSAFDIFNKIAERVGYAFSADGRVYSSFDAGAPEKTSEIKGDGFSDFTCERLFDCGLKVRSEFRVYRDFPVVELLAFITNVSDGNSGIISDFKTACRLSGARLSTLKHGNGDTCRSDGYSFFEDKLDKRIELSPTSGTSCQGAFPYFTIRLDAAEARIAVGWPGRWKVVFTPKDYSIEFECSQARLSTFLRPGESLRSPRLTLMIYEKRDAFFGINLWRRWYMRHILPHPNGKPVPPMLCLHNFRAGGHPEFTGADEENQLTALRTYIDKGIRPDVWWIDAGWYPCSYEWTRVGTWIPDSERFPNGLAPIGDYCEKHGIRLLLWFEPERVREDSLIDRAHPEWLLRRTLPDGSLSKNRLLDLGNREALKYIRDTIDGIIKDSRVGIYRQDFNFDPAPYWLQNEEEGREGYNENAHIRGYLALWDSLLESNHGLIIDSCASGGRRNDLETMRRAVTLHYTDVGYGNHPIKQKQHREMFEWIPYFRAHNMNWYNRDTRSYDGVERTPDSFSFHNALTPSMTAMLAYSDPDRQYEETAAAVGDWRRAAQIELSGDYYPLSGFDADPADICSYLFIDRETKSGFIHVIANYSADLAKLCGKIVIPAGIFERGDVLIADANHARFEAAPDGSLTVPVSLSAPGTAELIFFEIE